MISGAQIRMARAAAKLGVRELGATAKVSPNTITRAEADGALNPSTIAAIQRALEAAGIEFIDDNGVRLKAKPGIPSGNSTPGKSRKAATGKRAPAPKAKALPMSKEAQIRALREQSVDEV